VIASEGSEALKLPNFSWKQASTWTRIALGFLFLVAMADRIRSGLPELPGASELPNTLLYALEQALQDKPWNVAGIAALFILWLLLQILDRRLGDYRPPGDYWMHSVAWIALYLFMTGWEIVKLMTPSISSVSGYWFIWVWLVLALIVDYGIWVVALGPNGLKLDHLNWTIIDFATLMMAFFVVTLFDQLQGQLGAWRWLVAIFLLLASIASILLSHYGDFPAPKEYRWLRWLALAAFAAGFLFNVFNQQMVGADDVVSGLFAGLSLLAWSIGAIALIADIVLRFYARGPHQDLDEINYRYRRRR
jgi:hypothetical protein